MSAKSFNEGQRDGAEWLRKSKQSWIQQRLDLTYNPKPFRSNDADYNKGVAKAIKDGGGDKFL